jgi:hypothetical protein
VTGPVCTVHTIGPSPFTDFRRAKRDDAHISAPLERFREEDS